MGAVLALDRLLEGRQVWRGQSVQTADPPACPTGWHDLDAQLPNGGWPPASLSEVLLAADGVGELRLVLPALARVAAAGSPVVLISPPYRAHAPAWARAGLDLRQVKIVEATTREALWAAEQCLRSAACGAVLCWPHKADDRALRRLQVAAEGGQCLGFAFRDAREARNPSPAALRLLVEPGQVRVLKCRGASIPPHPVALSH